MLTATIACLSGGAQAFECAKASSRVEKAICSDPASKSADDAMNDAFGALRSRLDAGQKAAQLANQRRWLKERDTQCLSGDAKALPGCLREADAARTRALAATPDAGPGTPGPIVPVFLDRTGTRKTYDVSALLYRFENPKGPGEARLNAWADATLKDAPTKSDDDAGSSTYSWDRRARLAYASPRLLSVALTGYDFTGGAHGQSTASALNLDLERGRELTIADLATGKALGDIQAGCRQDLARELKSRLKENGDDPDKSPDARKEFDGTVKEMAGSINDVVADLTNWTFGRTGATVTFVSDSIGPHALGEFACEIPYGRLRPLAKADFPLPSS